jgi:hypothetical protein
MLNRIVVFALAAAGLAGCSTRPLPEDRALLDTVGIVKKVRCEAREAVIGEFLQLLSTAQDSPDKNREKTRKLGKDLINERAAWLSKLRALDHKERLALYGKPTSAEDPIRAGLYKYLKTIDPESHGLVVKYDDAVIGFDFVFDISQNEKASAGVSFLKPFFPGGSAGLGFGGSSDFLRSNRRAFGFTDSFRDLVLDVKDGDCVGLKSGFSVAYPITGDINLRESIGTFLRLNEYSELKLGEKVPLFSDQIKFETNLLVSAEPSLTLSHAGLGWAANSATATFSSERKDLHQLNLAISLPAEQPVGGGPVKVLPKERKGKSVARQNVVNELSNLRNADTLSRALRNTLQR